MKKYFDFFSLAILIALGPLFIFPKAKWNWLLLAGAAMIFFGRWISERRFLPRTPIDAAVGLLLMMAALGVLVIPDIEQSAGKMAGLAYGIIVFYALVDLLKTPKRVGIAVLAFQAAGLALAVLGTLGRNWMGYEVMRKPLYAMIISFLPKIPSIDLGLRGAEAGINPNALGGMLLLFIPLGINQLLFLIKNNNGGSLILNRTLGIAGALLFLGIQGLALLLTTSFSAWFAMAAVVWLLGNEKRKIKAVVSVLLFATIVFVSLKTGKAEQNERIGYIWTLEQTAQSRADKWEFSLAVSEGHRLLGIGMDQLRRIPKFVFADSHAHNQYLHTAVELGISGLIAYLAILIGVFWMAGDVRRSDLPERLRAISSGLAVGVLAFCIFGIADAIPLGAKPGVLFWISIAMITSLFLYARNRGRAASAEKGAPPASETEATHG